MINDKLINLYKYIPQDKKEHIAEFLCLINREMNEGTYEIDGTDMYARVMSYNGRERDKCKIEAHNQYVDVQFTLIGKEGIDIYRRENLVEIEPYNVDEDVAFFEESEKAYLTISNNEGYFSMIFPCEAHRPQIMVDEKSPYIKKGVIKIKESVFH